MVRITLPGWKCERCGHEWRGKTSEPPKCCGKCKSPYWQSPRKKETNGTRLLHSDNPG